MSGKWTWIPAEDADEIDLLLSRESKSNSRGTKLKVPVAEYKVESAKKYLRNCEKVCRVMADDKIEAQRAALASFLEGSE